jgi:molecular chaperone DnaK
VQGGLIAGIDVGPVLVDITPHTLGVQCLGEVHGRFSDRCFSPIITRNTPLPASRSEIYYTACEGQEKALVTALQGENEDAHFNNLVGEFYLEGLDEDAEKGSEIVVRFDLNLDGILTVAAVERSTGLERKLRIDNAITRFRAKSHEEAKSKLAAMFDGHSETADESETSFVTPETESHEETPDMLIAKVRELIPHANEDDADEMRALIDQFEKAAASCDDDQVEKIREQLEDLIFYLEDA